MIYSIHFLFTITPYLSFGFHCNCQLCSLFAVLHREPGKRSLFKVALARREGRCYKWACFIIDSRWVWVLVLLKEFNSLARILSTQMQLCLWFHRWYGRPISQLSSTSKHGHEITSTQWVHSWQICWHGMQWLAAKSSQHSYLSKQPFNWKRCSI